ncbi:TetR/AcrR family transcriptional regulator [Amycolatopsis magusensis]|uniref:TetR/AcrR family transcriptional regulator n=1 Tax=Amycolatopsis magusensis TaxID=882444 RepID=UPI0024A88BBE|nr:TetR/AcrR family transcriptional regulator [Amycolatopsis magusensis]MDI5976361.1 TetR/AcrR family transcriptional regulator [Amycolatopsis magusensis]
MAGDKQAIPSVWTRPRRGREQPALSREQIVAEAVRLLDADGLEALSMRTLGTRLGAGATSLYRHVANKDELIELVVDEVYGEIEVPSGGEWRAVARGCAQSIRSMIVRHPWIASALGQVGLSYLGPNVMRLNDGMLGIFESAGFTLAEADRALGAMVSYVIGMGITEAAWLTMLARSGKTEQEWGDYLRPTVEAAAEPYPRLKKLFGETTTYEDPGEAREDSFGYGLERMLDGLESRLGG